MSIESQRAGATLPARGEHYRAVAEAATDAIITIDSDSTILIVNPATERIFGYSNEEMIGQPLTILMPEYLRHLHKAGITRYLDKLNSAKLKLQERHNKKGECDEYYHNERWNRDLLQGLGHWPGHYVLARLAVECRHVGRTNALPRAERLPRDCP
jgi:PAS domain S-box-containing protein